jgi:ankyrin repeat protein
MGLGKEKLATEEIRNEMLLRKDNKGRTACHLATYRGKQDVMQKILDWAEEKLTTEVIRNETLLRTENDGRTAWHLAALFYQQDVIQIIWDWAK